MAFNGSGTFVRLYNWVNDAAAAIKIRADRMDAEMDGLATGLSTCVTKDGQTTITANLPMANFKHTGVGSATARTHYASAGQVADGSINWVAAGGTAEAITAAYTIPITTLVDGQLCFVRAASANATTTPTFSPSGLTARTIVKNGGAALVAGDIAGAGHELVLRYLLASTRWELLNPAGAGFATLAGNNNFTGTTTFTGNVSGSINVAGTASAAASMSLAEDTDNGTNKVTLTAPSSLAADYTLTLPSNDGDNLQFLQTDGSGNMSWKATGTTRQYLTSGSGATYTTPTGCRAILVRMIGGGGGGAAAATNAGSAGTASSFNSIEAAGGTGGSLSGANNNGGTGGTGSATFRMNGANGDPACTGVGKGGMGGGTFIRAGTTGGAQNAAGTSAATNSGCGGQGAATAGNCTGGGGAGEYVEIFISSPAATYTYTIGGGGNGGAAGTNAGGNGGSGLIIVDEYY